MLCLFPCFVRLWEGFGPQFILQSGLNCRLCQIHAVGQPPELARGFEIGDAVDAMLVHCDHHGTVGAGDRGEVNGPDTEGRPGWINVAFRHRTRGLNVDASQIYRHNAPPVLPGDLAVADRVVAMLWRRDPCGSIDPGDHGVVLGPATAQCGHHGANSTRERVKVWFPGCEIGRDVLPRNLYLLFAPPTLPGGFKIGETVLSLFAHQSASASRPGRVAYGDLGVVVGPDKDGLGGFIVVKFVNEHGPSTVAVSQVRRPVWWSVENHVSQPTVVQSAVRATIMAGTRLKNIALVTKTRALPKTAWLQVVRHFEPAHYEALIKRQIAELERQLIGIHNGRAPRRLAAV